MHTRLGGARLSVPPSGRFRRGPGHAFAKRADREPPWLCRGAGQGVASPCTILPRRHPAKTSARRLPGRDVERATRVVCAWSSKPGMDSARAYRSRTQSPRIRTRSYCGTRGSWVSAGPVVRRPRFHVPSLVEGRFSESAHPVSSRESSTRYGILIFVYPLPTRVPWLG